MSKSSKTPLERVLDATMDTEGMTRTECESELNAVHGIDLEAAEARLMSSVSMPLPRGADFLGRAKAAREAYTPKLSWSRFRERVESLTLDGLIDEIRGMDGAFAHRDFEAWSREDLESYLYDLKVLEERSAGDD